MTHRREVFESIVRGAVARRTVALMGVCNITPDSFSDGGQALHPHDARARVDLLLAEGADVIDIGAESTRPGARPVDPAEQLARALDAVRYAAEACRVRGNTACVSIDTQSPEVARACLEAGAVTVNDVSCLTDPDLARATAACDAALVLMHSRRAHADMREFGGAPASAYGDVVADVAREWRLAASRALEAGLPQRALYMDPGLGFAKAAEHSADLLRRLPELARAVEVPLVIGASRKSFLRLVDADAAPRDRVGSSLAAALCAVRGGAAVVRVHDVRATRQMVDMTRLLAPGTPLEHDHA